MAAYGNKNNLPVTRLNIRYMRMFSGAFMYAGGKHIGIEFGSVSGLSASMRYYVVVSVLDAFDGVTDIFGYQRFMTADSADPVPAPDPDSSESGGGTPSDGGDPIPPTGVPAAAGAVTLAALAAAAVILLRKKQDR